MVKDTKIKGTIKYVLFFNCFTGTLCISLRSTHSPRHHKMILEGTQCLISSPGWSSVQPGLYSTLEGSLIVPLSSYLLEDMGLNPGNWSAVQGGYPLYHSILSHPRRPSLLDPLPLDLSASLLFVSCVFCLVYSVEPSCEAISRSEDFINDLPSP